MSRVEEIEAAIDRLPPEEFRRVADWLRERLGQRWEEQLDRDSVAGKLDFLFREAEQEESEGRARDWPAHS
jgi:hypothetical protein